MVVVMWLILSFAYLIWVVINYFKLLQIRNGDRIMVPKQNAPKPMEWEVEILDFLKKFDRVSAAKDYAIKMGKSHWIKALNEVIKMEKLYLVEIKNHLK